uniref:CCR4-NOT transcription complex subunit 10 n=1 Tax=Nicotiana tabacum TaxID=4097 RepID=A0A1S3Y793_TOBAC|nr:PREDICTED: CCR4-NOT transcription complex subunit 10-like [Nicotiana tabacum]
MDTTSLAISRDAAPSSTTSSAAEDDGALSVNSGLAKEAALLFQSGKFADCCRVLHQLLQKKERDPKVLHNIAIAENFQDGCSNPKKLIDELNNAKKRSEELARAASDQAEPANNVGTKAVTGVNGSNSAPRELSSQQSSTLVYADEFDPSVTMYNLAVCWFHLHEHAKAFSILEGLFQNIEPIDEEIAKRICLLLLDVALLTQNAARSADVISYVEKVFCSSSLLGQVDNGNSAQPTASSIVVKSASFPSNSTIPDSSNPDSPAAGITSDGSLSRTLSEEGLEDDALHLISSMEIGGQNLPRQSGLKSKNDSIRSQTDESISTADMRIKLHLCKVRFLLLTRNLKAAKREVKMAMNTARAKDHSMALYLKSQLEYARGNHRKAIKLLMASSNRTEMGISSIYYNNLGCIYYRLGKHHTSSVLFAKALSNSSSLRKEQPLKLSTISQDKSLLITYNCGVQYLACGKPLQAASCFYKATQVFYNRPLLWLRIAECCLMALEKGLLKASGTAASDRSEVKVHVVGKGKWRQLVMEDGILRNGQESLSGAEDLVVNDRQPKLSVLLARQCLLNALHLLNCSESKGHKSMQPRASGLEESETGEAVPSKSANSKNGSTGDPKALNVAASGQINANGEVKEQKGVSSQHASLSSSICEYEAIGRKENLMIEQAVLADLAFVELELGNPLRALTIAKSLLKVQECSKIYIFLGNVYAAEALCLLNRPKEAVEHLSTYIAGSKCVDLPFSQEDSEMWRQEKTLDFEDTNGGSATLNSFPPEESQAFVFLKPEEARGMLFANLAAMSVMQGDIEQAQNYAVQALSTKPQRPEAILTAVYVDLLRGRSQEALTKLKHCSRIRFLPGSPTLNGSS